MITLATYIALFGFDIIAVQTIARRCSEKAAKKSSHYVSKIGKDERCKLITNSQSDTTYRQSIPVPEDIISMANTKASSYNIIDSRYLVGSRIPERFRFVENLGDCELRGFAGFAPCSLSVPAEPFPRAFILCCKVGTIRLTRFEDFCMV